MGNRVLDIVFFLLAVGAVASGQSVSILTPNNSDLDRSIASNLRAALSVAARVQDPDMTSAAFASSGRSERAFNMSTDEARNLASILGTDFLILVRSGTQRRASLDKPDYFESFAALYLVSGRSGQLVKWNIQSENGADRKDSEHRLASALSYDQLLSAIRSAMKAEVLESQPAARIEEVPESGTAAARDFRAPVPYRRLKPEYTRTAYLYDVTATVEATVDLDEKGIVVRSVITRWAGYGLDESVLTVIRSMNWRPAERSGRPLPIRFLLRYNFKKLEKDDQIDE